MRINNFSRQLPKIICILKKLLFTGALFSVMLLGCKKEQKTDYSALILGTWTNTHIDGVPVLTDNSFAFEFRADNTQPYAMGYVLDDNNRTWIQNDPYPYSVNGNRITIDGTNKLGHVFHMEFLIQSVDGSSLVYSVDRFLIDNIEYPDPKIYTNRKETSDLSGRFTGTWYGRSTTAGSDSSYHYWNYFEDGRFNYYYRDSLGQWVNKPDNEGRYFLYGSLLATNYTNDLLSGGTGKAYECWNISIQGDTMKWSGLRPDGLVTTFRMVRVPGPPVL